VELVDLVARVTDRAALAGRAGVWPLALRDRPTQDLTALDGPPVRAAIHADRATRRARARARQDGRPAADNTAIRACRWPSDHPMQVHCPIRSLRLEARRISVAAAGPNAE